MGNNKKHKKSAGTFEIERLDPNHTPWFTKKLVLEHLERYKFASQFCKDKIVIDMGCGTGYGSKHIAEKGAKKVYSYDLDLKAIEYAETHYSDNKIFYRTSSADDTKLPDNYADLVICFEVIEHIAKPQKVIAEIYRILKPGGLCILSTPNRLTSFQDNPYHLKEFKLNEIKSLMNSFSKLEYFGQRKLNKFIIRFYQFLYKNITFRKLKFLLKLRPWENYKIDKLIHKTNPSYLYLLVIAKK